MKQSKDQKNLPRLNIIPVSDLTIECFSATEKASKIKNPITGLPTGFRDLDRITLGFEPSDLVILASRPSMGKSTLASNIAVYNAVKLKKNVLFLSPSSTSQQVIRRMLCGAGALDTQDIRRGSLNKDDWQRYITVCDRLSKSPLYIDDNPPMFIDDLINAIDAFHKEHSLDLIIIDYIQLFNGVRDKKYDSRAHELSDISHAIKAYAKQSKTVIILLSELSRTVESRNFKRPILSDLRDSGSLEDDADYVLFLYREEVYDPDTEQANHANLIIAKNRFGPTDSVDLFFAKRFTIFISWELIENGKN